MKPLVMFLFLLLASAVMGEEWQELFDGKDLKGWRANVHPDSFVVVEGAIKAHATKPYSHLFYVGDASDGEFVSFQNFVLEMKVRTEEASNGGIFFHTDFVATGNRNKLINGLEVQINSSPKEERKTGSLYRVVDLHESPVNPTDWFSVRLTVRDKHVIIELNDEVVVDYTEPEGYQGEEPLSNSGGAIALQAHDPDSIVYYKDIRIKDLP